MIIDHYPFHKKINTMVKNPKTEVATIKDANALQQDQPIRAMNPLAEMESIMGNLLPRGWLNSPLWERPFMGEPILPCEGEMPRVDVIEGDKKNLVRTEIP